MSKTVFELVRIKLWGDISSMITFMRGRNAKDKGMTVGTALIIGVIIIAFAFMMIFSFGLASVMGFQMQQKGCDWLYFPMGMASAGVFAFIGTVFAAQSYLFDAKDNELLLSMPIKPSQVLLSRMISLYLLNFVYVNLVYLPTGVAFALLNGYNFQTGLIYICSMFILPMLVTSVASVFGFFIGKLAEKIPNKNILTVLLGFFTIGIFSVLIVNFGDIMELMMNEVDIMADWVDQRFPFVSFYGEVAAFGAWHDPLGFFLAVLPPLAVTALVVYLVTLFLSRRFSRIVTRKSAMKKKKYVRKTLKRSNIQLTLVKKELGYFLSIPSYVMNAGMSTIMSVMLGVGIIMRGDSINELLPQLFPDASSNLMGLAIGSSLALSCTLNDVTAPSISLEGKTIWILKSTPLSPMKVFIAKALLAPIVCMPGVIFSATAASIVLKLNAADVIFVIVIPILASIFSGFLGVCVNLKLPRFDWTNEITVIKQSLSVIFTLLMSAFFTAIPFILAILPTAYLEDFRAVWAYGLCILYFILLVGLEIFFLSTDGKKIWDSL